jgi:MFS family permease
MLAIMFANSIRTFLVVHAAKKGISNLGVFFNANAIAIAVARLSIGKISQKFGSVAVIAPGIAITGLAMIGMYSSAKVAVLVISGTLYGLGMGMAKPELNTFVVWGHGMSGGAWQTRYSSWRWISDWRWGRTPWACWHTMPGWGPSS